ncbi:MAG TPA: hypothetical protein VHH36_03055, partial [Candidatus Thermoplasmatota archaeon]|nr:hypothetical protein [Candidatus Thermoplasmatota archaeon]
VSVSGGSVDAASLALAGGSVLSAGTRWTLRGAGTGMDAIVAPDGVARFDGGEVEIASGAARVLGARVAFVNLSLDATKAAAPALHVERGELLLQGVTTHARPVESLVDVRGGVARLHDAPMPPGAPPPWVEGDGVVEIGWTLTVRAVALPAQAPAAGVSLALASAHAPGATAGRATTDADGVARFLAIERVVGASATRSGNPHAVVSEHPGLRGATPAVVVEGPSEATLALAPVPFALPSVIPLSG